MKKSIFLTALLSFTLFAGGCTIVDPLIFTFGFPFDVCTTLSGGNSWDDEETYNLRDEIANIDAGYLEDVVATRVNDVRVYMPAPPSSGMSSGSVSFAFDGGALMELATWTDVPFSSLADPGISVVSSPFVTLNPGSLAFLLGTLQDSTELPVITTLTVATDGSTSVTVPESTKICVSIDYQIDVEN